MPLKSKYSPLQKFSVQNVVSSFNELAPDKKIVAMTVLLVVSVLFVFLPSFVFSHLGTSVKRDIQNAQKSMNGIEDKISQYRLAKRDIETMEKRFGRGGGSLNTRIESLVKELGYTVDQLKEKPVQETDIFEIASVEVRLTNIPLEGIMLFLQRLEKDPTAPMRVKRLQIKSKGKNRQFLEASMELTSLSLKKEG